MKHFMIKYQFANGTTEDWHREIGRFIAALNSDPELKGKISYRCMKNRDDTSYYHLAASRRSRRCSSAISSSIIRKRPGRSPAARLWSHRSS